MIYLSADSIFDGYRFRSAHEVLAIQEDGTIIGFFNKTPDLKVERYKGILAPGFINAHCHIELSYLKNEIAKGGGLVNFLIAMYEQYKKGYAMEHIQNAIYKADNEMYKNGIVAVGDISNTLNSLECKKSSKIYYHTFVECMGLLDAHAEKRFEEALHMQQAFEAIGSASIVLHAPYSVSDTLIQLVKNHNIHSIQSIHIQECEAENELFEKGSGEFHRLFEHILGKPYSRHRVGISSLKYFLENHKSKHSILVHNTATRKEDIKYVQQTNKPLSYCLCPRANLYIEGRLPPLEELLLCGVPIVIGTDSLASNTSLNLLDEVHCLQVACPSVPLSTWLQSLTINGAIALGIDDTYGSFTPGKKPGVVCIKEREGLLDGQDIQRIY